MEWPKHSKLPEAIGKHFLWTFDENRRLIKDEEMSQDYYSPICVNDRHLKFASDKTEPKLMFFWEFWSTIYYHYLSAI